MIAIKALGIWLLLALVAMLNGLLREKLLSPWLGIQVALPVSGLTLCAGIFGITYWFVPSFGRVAAYTLVMIGLMWVCLTLIFEIGLGHYLAHKPWNEIFQVFDIRKGDLFSLALVVCMVSPWLAARIRGIV